MARMRPELACRPSGADRGGLHHTAARPVEGGRSAPTTVMRGA
jgi:hypothetical protein